VRIEKRSDTEPEIAQENSEVRGYRKLIVADGKLVGALLVADPANAQTVSTAVKEHRDVSGCLEALQAGHWEVLGDVEADPTPLRLNLWPKWQHWKGWPDDLGMRANIDNWFRMARRYLKRVSAPSSLISS
jgi:hypothetical protein